jgi:hypothetical protein
LEQAEGLISANQIYDAKDIYLKLQKDFPNDPISGYVKDKLADL